MSKSKRKLLKTSYHAGFLIFVCPFEMAVDFYFLFLYLAFNALY